MEIQPWRPTAPLPALGSTKIHSHGLFPRPVSSIHGGTRNYRSRNPVSKRFYKIPTKSERLKYANRRRGVKVFEYPTADTVDVIFHPRLRHTKKKLANGCRVISIFMISKTDIPNLKIKSRKRLQSDIDLFQELHF